MKFIEFGVMIQYLEQKALLSTKASDVRLTRSRLAWESDASSISFLPWRRALQDPLIEF